VQGFEFMLEQRFDALASLRQKLTAWLERAGVEDGARSNVVLATHEAAANALEHGASTEPVAVSAHLTDSLITVEINDRGRWKVQSSPDEERGRGLLLIENLVSDVEIRRDARGTTLRLLYRPGTAHRAECS
jgi:anti-sigma regulatory factor (Ser/Thr protein kinase)